VDTAGVTKLSPVQPVLALNDAYNYLLDLWGLRVGVELNRDDSVLRLGGPKHPAVLLVQLFYGGVVCFRISCPPAA